MNDDEMRKASKRSGEKGTVFVGRRIKKAAWKA